MLRINNLNANIDNKSILKDFSLNINAGEVHAIMGPNGSGKSTLSNILSGKKGYEVSGEVLFENKNQISTPSLASDEARAIEYMGVIPEPPASKQSLFFGFSSFFI